MNDDNKIVKYDNTFNKTSLTVFSKVEANVLMSVLSCMDEKFTKIGESRYSAVFEFSEIRELTNAKSLHTSRIKKALDALLDTKIEFYRNGSHVKGNLFSHYEVNMNGQAEIELTTYMSEKMNLGKGNFTILQLNEYNSLPNSYSKELYRMLRQFRHKGFFVINKNELIRMMEPPKSYNEYDFVRKVLLPAIEENKKYFENLTINVQPKNVLPNVVEFTFKKHKRIKSKKIEIKNEKEELRELDMIEYMKTHGG